MKEILVQYGAYNFWANRLLSDVITALPEEKKTAEVPSSFNSLYKTVLHMRVAENNWWQRLHPDEKAAAPAENFKEDTTAVISLLLQQNQRWNDWLAQLSEGSLTQDVVYKNSKGDAFRQPLFQILLHLFNHGTYHRGQIVNMLRQVGVEKIPPTDFIVWSRS